MNTENEILIFQFLPEEPEVHPVCKNYEFLCFHYWTDHVFQNAYEPYFISYNGGAYNFGYPVDEYEDQEFAGYYVAQNSIDHSKGSEIIAIEYFSGEFEKGVALSDLEESKYLDICRRIGRLAGGFIKSRFAISNEKSVLAEIEIITRTRELELQKIVSELVQRLDQYLPARKKNGWQARIKEFELLNEATFGKLAMKSSKTFLTEEGEAVSGFTLSHVTIPLNIDPANEI